MRINEVMAGLNGDSSIQFFEMVASGCGQKDWGPQGAETVGRVMVVFFDAAGTQTGRFVVNVDPPGSCGSLPNPAAGGGDTVLFATQAFADLTGITPDFIFPEGVMPIAGKACFKNNPDASGAFGINLCLSYGGAGFTGSTEGAGAANAADLTILGSESISRNSNFSPGANLNADFDLATPTPNSTQNDPVGTGEETNAVGEVVLPGVAPVEDQGENLFKRETFLGNGRTCATCHFADDNFGLTPTKVAGLPADDLLFMNTVNVNTLVVNSAGSVNSGAGTGTPQPSDFFLGGTITGTLSGGASATVLAGTGTTYLIHGGSLLDVPGNVISDGNGNTGTLASFTAGNLVGPNPVNLEARGIEDTLFLLTGGRALITENINGFPETTFMRTSLNLLNLEHTAPYGLSGEFADLETFANGAVQQHFPRRLQRVGTGLPVAANDFRLPTSAELDAMAAFMDTIFFPADEDFDEGNNFDKFVSTAAQARGRTLFFGTAKCSVCHNGNVLATSDGQFSTTVGVNEEFNTGVANLPINTVDGLPPEQDMGSGANTREFSTRPLFGVKDTAPFFHDNSVATLIEAIQFYDTLPFLLSPAFTQVGAIDDVGILQNALDIQAFLEGLGCEPCLPGFTKSFGPGAIASGGVSTLTFTIDNMANTTMLTALDFTDTLPAGVTVAPTPNAGTTCSSGAVTADTGTGVISFTGGTVPASSMCMVSADVTSSTVAAHVNTSGDLMSSAGNSGSATDTLTVLTPPVFTKAFAPAAIANGGVSTLTFTINNTANPAAVAVLDFTDTLPAGVVVASPPNDATTCSGGTVTAVAASGVISYTGGTVSASSSCTVSADVTSITVGAHLNTSGNLTSFAGNSGTAMDTLTVACISVLVLANQTIMGSQVFLGNSVTLGPNLVVDGTSIEIQAAATVTFLNDTEIGGGFAAGTGFPCFNPPAPPPTTTQQLDTSGDIAILLDGLRAGGRLIAGESMTLTATASSQVFGVDFLANGSLLATDTAPPFELLFTAPAGVGSVTFSVVAHDGAGTAVPSFPVSVPIDADLLATVSGRVVDAQGLPVTGAVVDILSEGLQAEYFDFATPLGEMPDLVGLTPDRVTRVTALNLRNPNGIFGVDPFGIPPIAPDYAARFTGWLMVPDAGTYTFFLGADEGARLRIGGVVIADVPGGQHRYQEVPATVDLEAGPVPIDVVFYESVGNAELQLSWAPPNMERQVVAPDSLVPALRPFVTLTDANGFFSVADVPTALENVRVRAAVVEPSLSAVTSMILRLRGGQAVDIGDLVIP